MLFHVVYSTCYAFIFVLVAILQAYIAWHTIADITEFHIDFSFVVYNDRWLQWHSEFEKFMLFRYFSIFGFM